jgi:hypothetical protein
VTKPFLLFLRWLILFVFRVTNSPNPTLKIPGWAIPFGNIEVRKLAQKADFRHSIFAVFSSRVLQYFLIVDWRIFKAQCYVCIFLFFFGPPPGASASGRLGHKVGPWPSVPELLKLPLCTYVLCMLCTQLSRC